MSDAKPTEALLPCPFCSGAMQFRQALWPSDGNVDAIIHAASTNCPMMVFSDYTTNRSIVAKWNRRAFWREIGPLPPPPVKE